MNAHGSIRYRPASHVTRSMRAGLAAILASIALLLAHAATAQPAPASAELRGQEVRQRLIGNWEARLKRADGREGTLRFSFIPRFSNATLVPYKIHWDDGAPSPNANLFETNDLRLAGQRLRGGGFDLVMNQELTLGTGQLQLYSTGKQQVEFRKLATRIERVEVLEPESALDWPTLAKPWSAAPIMLPNMPRIVVRLHGVDLPYLPEDGVAVAGTAPQVVYDRHAVKTPENRGRSIDLRFALLPRPSQGPHRFTLNGAPFDLELPFRNLPGPEILAVLPTSKQKEADDGVSDLPYPFDGRTTVGWARYRTLLVVGRNFPRRLQQINLTADDAPVAYQVEALTGEQPSEVSPNSVHLRRGFERLHGKPTPPDGLDWMLVQATLNPGVLPGDVPLILNGTARGQWLLSFGDATGQIGIVRPVREGEFEAAPFVLIGEPFAVSVVADFALPTDTVELRLGVAPPGAAAAATQIVVPASRVRARTWRTQPLYINEVPPGATAGTAIPAANGATLLATVDERGLIELNPSAAQAKVAVTPAVAGSTWREALIKAAGCAGDDVKKLLQEPSTDTDVLAASVLVEWRSKGLDAKLGDHAAMLLLRETFLLQMQRARADYQAIGTDPQAALGFRRMLARQPRASAAHLLGIEVHAPKTGKLKLDEAIDPDVLARIEGLPAAAAEELSTRLTQEGLRSFLDSMDAAIDRATEIDTCDIVGLLNLTGPEFGAVRAELMPRLLALHSNAATGNRWTPDRVARAHVTGVEALYGANQARKEFQRAAVTAAVTAIATAVTLGASTLGTGVISASLVAAAEVGQAAFVAMKLLPQWAKNRSDIAFAAGEASVLGVERLERLQREAPNWMEVGGAALAIGSGTFKAIAAGSKVLAMDRAAVIGDSIRRGERLAPRFATDGPGAMTDAEKTDLLHYLGTVRARQAEAGAALTESEAAALRTLDDLAAGRPPARVAAGLGRPIMERHARRYDRGRLEALLRGDDPAAPATPPREPAPGAPAAAQPSPSASSAGRPPSLAGRISTVDSETVRVPPRAVVTERFGGANPEYLRRMESDALERLARAQPGASEELHYIYQARRFLRDNTEPQRLMAVEAAQAAERLGVPRHEALQHASMFAVQPEMTRAKLLAHTLLGKVSTRRVPLQEFARESGLSVEASRQVLIDAARLFQVKLPPDLTIPGRVN